MSMIICCGCEYDGPDRSKCGVWDGHPGACQCSCHDSLFVAVALNRAEVVAAVADAGFEVSAKLIADRLCQRWGIDR